MPQRRPRPRSSPLAAFAGGAAVHPGRAPDVAGDRGAGARPQTGHARLPPVGLRSLRARRPLPRPCRARASAGARSGPTRLQRRTRLQYCLVRRCRPVREVLQAVRPKRQIAQVCAGAAGGAVAAHAGRRCAAVRSAGPAAGSRRGVRSLRLGRPNSLPRQPAPRRAVRGAGAAAGEAARRSARSRLRAAAGPARSPRSQPSSSAVRRRPARSADCRRKTVSGAFPR